jgi:hypothetical protein
LVGAAVGVLGQPISILGWCAKSATHGTSCTELGAFCRYSIDVDAEGSFEGQHTLTLEWPQTGSLATDGTFAALVDIRKLPEHQRRKVVVKVLVRPQLRPDPRSISYTANIGELFSQHLPDVLHGYPPIQFLVQDEFVRHSHVHVYARLSH